MDGGSNKKSKRLTIYIEPPAQQDYNNNFDDKVQPLIVVRGTREKPGMVEATVTLEVDTACEGDEVEIQFRAVIGSKISVKGGGFSVSLSEQVLQRKRWILPVTKLGPYVIAAGVYSRQVCTMIETNWPSSCTEHSEGFVQYSFHAQITKVSAAKVAMPILTASQEFLVLNLNNSCENYSNYNNYNQYNNFSKFNFHGKENYSKSDISNISYIPRNKHNYMGVLPGTSTPHSVSVLSPEKSVPIEMSIPSETLVFGQRVPITIAVNPFSEWTPFAGQEIVVMEARFGIEQKRHARSANRIIKDKIVKNFTEIHVPSTRMGSWPQSRNGWKRTVSIKLPAAASFTEKSKPVRPGQHNSPLLLSQSLQSRYYDISHKLIVSLKVRTSGEKDKQAEEIELHRKFNQ
ncbi:hypothetical protein BGZ79_003697 [Entomortierella chlamydospora]|nr:hypothetical protein BGZ79_003697 [Entomortierella chlamydospora]